MFVEQFSWSVPASQKESSKHVLQLLCHYMDASGGLIRAVSGDDINNRDKLTCLSFWKSWEDLARFLASPKASCLAEANKQRSIESPKPHHFEVIWQWPEEITDGFSGDSHWAIHDFSADERNMDVLFDGVRQAVPRLQSHKGFRSASLWVDKNNQGHAAMASRWAGDASPDDSIIDAVVLVSSVKAQVKEVHRNVFRMHALDPHLVSTR